MISRLSRHNLGAVRAHSAWTKAERLEFLQIAIEALSTTGGVERTGAKTWGTYTLTAAGKALIDDADAAAARTTLGLGTLATASSVSAFEA